MDAKGMSWIVVALPFVVAVQWACGEARTVAGGDADADTDGDAGTDADAATDAGSDAETAADADGADDGDGPTEIPPIERRERPECETLESRFTLSTDFFATCGHGERLPDRAFTWTAPESGLWLFALSDEGAWGADDYLELRVASSFLQPEACRCLR